MSTLTKATPSTEPKMTQPTQAVLRAFLDNPDVERFGLDIIAETGMVSGTLYPILARLEQSGWLQSRLDDVTFEHLGRRSRRYFRLTKDGAAKAQAALDKADAAAQDRRDRYATASLR